MELAHVYLSATGVTDSSSRVVSEAACGRQQSCFVSYCASLGRLMVC
jgi:hypothetical protein